MRSGSGRRYSISAGLVGLSILTFAAAWAGIDPAAIESQALTNDAKAQHTAAANADVRRSEAERLIPNVMLIRDDGKSVALASELDDGRPVVLNFIYTSCTTICPLSSQLFEQFQEDLGAQAGAVHLMSISIDPEEDTPARLRAYAAQFHAKRGWDHYSGSLASTMQVQRAFNAYRGEKMSHSPLTLMRAAPGKPWVRFDGFARADDLMTERKSWDLPAAPAALVAR
jgi:protein SCO1/2